MVTEVIKLQDKNVLYSFAQIFKYFALFCRFLTFICPFYPLSLKNRTHALTF